VFQQLLEPVEGMCVIDLIDAVDRYLSIDKAPSAEWLLEAAETLDAAAKTVPSYGQWRPKDLAFAAELCRKRANGPDH
jgi:hypothetical protein